MSITNNCTINKQHHQQQQQQQQKQQQTANLGDFVVFNYANSFDKLDINFQANEIAALLKRDGQVDFDREEEAEEGDEDENDTNRGSDDQGVKNNDKSNHITLIKQDDDNDEDDDYDQADETQMPLLLCGFDYRQAKWRNVIWLVTLHLAFVWAFAHCTLTPVKLASVIWTIFCSICSGFGMSVGAHRLWAHRTFRAAAPLRFALVTLQTMTINGSVLSFARDHRNHHKWPATDADPKNPARGFVFAHIGWWLYRKRPEVLQFGAKVPIDDLRDETMITLQHRYYLPLVCLIAIAAPIAVPVIGWREDLRTSIALCTIRVVVVLHHLFTVNSVAHFCGYRPYNRFQKPTENRFINWISMGEGNHNYHHTFPFDYRNSEYVWWESFNPASLFIDTCVRLRLATALKRPSAELINRVIAHKGMPEYFADIHRRSRTIRIVLGIADWIAGLLLAQWPMWIVALCKLCTGLPLIVIA